MEAEERDHISAMKTSVLMSVYKNDCPEYLRLALESIYDNQTRKPDEIVVVFDGPLTEELYAVLDNFKKGKEDIVRCFPFSENRGLSAALRYGLEKCRNELVLRMDSDDICSPDRFEEMVRLFEEHPELEVAGAFATMIDNEGKEGQTLIVPTTEENIYKKVWTCPFVHPTVCFKKSALMRVGSYSENPGPRQDDYELWFRVVDGGLRCMNLRRSLLYYRFTTGSVARNSVRVGWARFKVGIRGAWKCKCVPIAYIGVAYPLFRSLMPKFIREWLYKVSYKFNPRVK